MRAIDAVRKPPATVASDASIADAARMMDTLVIGALVVMDGDRPVGVVTDRDIAIRSVARDVPTDARVDAVMSSGVIAMEAGAELRMALTIFHSHAIRRLPLVEDGRIVGMLTTDDLLIDIVADLGEIVRPITGQVVFGYSEPANLPARRPASPS
jgi:signal-transduction protein with cAMP-binding, CBS, and nucleotidyltransferase domain